MPPPDLPPIPAPSLAPTSADRAPDAAAPRRRLAALSAIGALMVALPTAEMLRYQADELAAVRLEQAGLDPMARAVDVQASVIDHRDLAGRMLRGDAGVEPQRLLQQETVDSRLGALSTELATNLWPRARNESDALRSDWQSLVQALTAHRIDAAGSDGAHRLLVEQSLQVIDDLGSAGALHTRLDGDATAEALRQARSLPRERWHQAQLEATPDGSTLTAAAAPSRLRESASSVALLQRFKQLHATSALRLDERIQKLERQRLALSAAIALLAAMAGGLIWQLARNRDPSAARLPPRPDGAVVKPMAGKPAPAEFDAVAQAALQRMRQGRHRNKRDRHAAAPSTLPPDADA
ncbi:MAG: hypothetical protein ABIN96_17460 [Rubrivivax sp.]